jgi:aminopeptidase 2
MATSTHHPQREILPTNVVPTHYKLHLTPDFSTFKFAGNLAVTLDVKKPTRSIVLNALELELKHVEVDAGGKLVKSKTVSMDEEGQIATFDFEEELDVTDDQTTLKIEFTGVLNDKMAGFYRSSYIDKKTGEKKWLATTQMGTLFCGVVDLEPTDARRAFPCWDEPGVKATFEVEITADKGLTVLSNMDVNSERTSGGRTTTLFNPTPKMSTYVLRPSLCVDLVTRVYRGGFRID